MDSSKEPSKEVSEDQARELLIAISYSLPDKVPNSEEVPGNSNEEGGVAETNMSTDGADKYRSELISISYNQYPDTTMLPVTIEAHKG